MALAVAEPLQAVGVVWLFLGILYWCVMSCGLLVTATRSAPGSKAKHVGILVAAYIAVLFIAYMIPILNSFVVQPVFFVVIYAVFLVRDAI